MGSMVACNILSLDLDKNESRFRSLRSVVVVDEIFWLNSMKLATNRGLADLTTYKIDTHSHSQVSQTFYTHTHTQTHTQTHTHTHTYKYTHVFQTSNHNHTHICCYTHSTNYTEGIRVLMATRAVGKRHIQVTRTLEKTIPCTKRQF